MIIQSKFASVGALDRAVQLFLFRVFSVLFGVFSGRLAGRDHRIQGKHGIKAEQESAIFRVHTLRIARKKLCPLITRIYANEEKFGPNETVATPTKLIDTRLSRAKELSKCLLVFDNVDRVVDNIRLLLLSELMLDHFDDRREQGE